MLKIRVRKRFSAFGMSAVMFGRWRSSGAMSFYMRV